MGLGCPLAVFKMTRIDHVGIATRDIEKASNFWAQVGLEAGEDHINEEQDVKIRMFYGRDKDGKKTHSKVELIEALSESSPIAKFIDKKGVGIQQLAISVDDIDLVFSNLIESQLYLGGNFQQFIFQTLLNFPYKLLTLSTFTLKTRKTHEATTYPW